MGRPVPSQHLCKWLWQVLCVTCPLWLARHHLSKMLQLSAGGFTPRQPGLAQAYVSGAQGLSKQGRRGGESPESERTELASRPQDSCCPCAVPGHGEALCRLPAGLACCLVSEPWTLDLGPFPISSFLLVLGPPNLLSSGQPGENPQSSAKRKTVHSKEDTFYSITQSNAFLCVSVFPEERGRRNTLSLQTPPPTPLNASQLKC